MAGYDGYPHHYTEHEFEDVGATYDTLSHQEGYPHHEVGMSPHTPYVYGYGEDGRTPPSHAAVTGYPEHHAYPQYTAPVVEHHAAYGAYPDVEGAYVHHEGYRMPHEGFAPHEGYYGHQEHYYQ